MYLLLEHTVNGMVVSPLTEQTADFTINLANLLTIAHIDELELELIENFFDCL